MIILVGNQKGGVGKSTIACSIAVALANDDQDVLLVDADKQLTTTAWSETRRMDHPKLDTINSIQKTGDVSLTLKDLVTRYQYVVVDVSGRDSVELRSAMTVCHLLLMILSQGCRLRSVMRCWLCLRLKTTSRSDVLPQILFQYLPHQLTLLEVEFGCAFFEFGFHFEGHVELMRHEVP